MADRGFDGMGDDPGDVFAPVAVSNPSTDAQRAAALLRVVDEFRRVVSHWRYPPATLRRVTAAHASTTYRRIRESVRDNVLDLLGLTRQLVDQRRWDDARTLLERADDRWSRWIAQVDAMAVLDPVVDATTADHASQAFAEFGNDLARLPSTVVRSVASSDWGKAALVAGGLFIWLKSR